MTARTLTAAIMLLAAAGCAIPRANVDPDGRLAVLGPTPGFSITSLPDDWVIAGDARLGRRNTTLVHRQGVPALRVENGAAAFVVARRTDVSLLASPFLSWSWHVEPHAGETHPVRLMMGFHGGDPESRSWGAQPFAWLGRNTPPHDRMISLAWGVSALRRGAIDPPSEDGRGARYTQRGGIENTATWWLETVDVSDIYARIWPADDLAAARIVFVGMSAAGGGDKGAALVSGIVISR
jgi:hypothetical protein